MCVLLEDSPLVHQDRSSSNQNCEEHKRANELPRLATLNGHLDVDDRFSHALSLFIFSPVDK